MMTNANASSVRELWAGANREVCCPYRDSQPTRSFLAKVWETHYVKAGGVCTGGVCFLVPR